MEGLWEGEAAESQTAIASAQRDRKTLGNLVRWKIFAEGLCTDYCRPHTKWDKGIVY